MKRILVLVGVLCFVCFAQTPVEKTSVVLKNKFSSVSDGTKVLVWIFFKDKGNSLNKFYSTPKNVVSELSFKRRGKVMDKSSLIDFTDLPVYEDYITKLQTEGFEVKQISKWFNGVSGYILKQDFDNVLGLPFVDKADIVYRFKNSPEIKRPKIDLNKVSPTNKPPGVNSLNYGPSFAQLNQINVPALHDMGYRGQGVTICVMDAGISLLNHEAFDSLKIIATYDFVNHRKYVGDDSGGHGEGSHGTMTLSLIGGYKPGQIIGPAYGSNFILAKTENTDSESPIEEDNWIAAMEWADSIGVEVTSTSLGYLAFDDSVAQFSYTWQSMDGRTARITKGAVLAARKGIMVVNAAGNEGDNPTHNTLDAPADADSIITVGAVDISGVRASFSSVGNTVDGRTKPDVMALGVYDYIADPYNATSYNSSFYGTSFACPLTAGVCALLLSYNPKLTPIQVRDALRNTASQLNSPDRHMGWGIIDALAALNYTKTLSVELSSFTATQFVGGVELKWTTATEIDFSFFEIEKKQLGNETWQTISSIKASGNSNAPKKYSFIDKNTTRGRYNYRLKIVDSNGTYTYSIIVEVDVSSPEKFTLGQNYPNPFNPLTKISYDLPVNCFVNLKIFDALGKEVVSLINETKPTGSYVINFNSSGLSSGVYFYSIRAISVDGTKNFVAVKKMILLK